jgi:hypothetical protein
MGHAKGTGIIDEMGENKLDDSRIGPKDEGGRRKESGDGMRGRWPAG